MARKVIRLACAALCLAIWGRVASAGVSHDPDLTWRTLHSTHFRVHFHDGLDAAAARAAAIAEDTHHRLSTIFDWSPTEPVDIVLTDEIDLSNGYSQPFPANRVVLILAPLDDGLFDYDEWLASLIAHEYVHTLHLDMASGAPLQLRQVFGRHPLLFPGLYEPSWFIEGIATYHETDEEHGTGRGQSSYFDMLMRKEVANGLMPVTQVNQTIRTWPSGATPYLYGYYFYEFIANRYGSDKVQELLHHFRRNLIPFRINSNSSVVLGNKLEPLWDEFEQYLIEKYAGQRAQIEQEGVVEGERLSHHGFTTGNTRALADGTLYYVRADGRAPVYLMKRAPGSSMSTAIVELQGDARLDVSSRHGVLVAQPERFRNARVHFDLYRVNESAGELTRLTRGGRYRFANWMPEDGSIVAVEYAAGNMALVQLEANGQPRARLWQGGNGEIISYPDVSPDGRSLVAAVWRPGGGWNLELFEFASRSWRPLTHDAAVKLHPRFTPDGTGVLFAADYSGVYNIYRRALGDGELQRLTNVTGGAFSPSLSAAGVLFYTGYQAEGHDAYRVTLSTQSRAPAQPRPGMSSAPRDIASVDGELQVTDYAPQHGLAPTYWTPLLAIGGDRATVGAMTSGQDPLERHLYNAFAGYDFEQDQWLAGLDYLYDGWKTLVEAHVARDFSIGRLNDELVTVRERYLANMALGWPILGLTRQWLFQVGVAAEFESDSYVASSFVAQPDTKDYLLGAAVTFDSARYFPLSISRSHGRRVAIVAEDSDVIGGDYTGEVYTVDWREFLALGREHVLSLRFVQGWGTESPRQFQLGGSFSAAGEMSLLETAGSGIPLNERDYALRGYPEGLVSLRGRRMQLLSAEWRFPLARIERGIMAPPMGIDQLAGSVFADVGAAWSEGGSPDDYSRGFGIELHADTRFFYHLPLRLRLGYASGRDRFGDDEVYLQVGSSF